MIDFACKKFELEEVIKCGLGLTKADYLILMHLMKSKDRLKSYDLTKDLNLELSTVQRSLKRLNEKNLVLRFQINLISGGYVYTYTINDKKIIRKIVLETIQSWTKKVEEEIEKW